VNRAELGPIFPTVCTASLEKVVESIRQECKARPKAVLKPIRDTPALHIASITVHNSNIAQGVFSGAFSHSSWWRSSEKSRPVTRPSVPFSKVSRVVLPLG
jgi:hypothetical protein